MSTPNRHTPGPWRVSEVSCDVLAPSAAKDTAGEPNYWRIIAEVPALGPSPVETRERHGTARLIAAAPLMLEALENLENDDGQRMPDSAWRLVLDAIASATGKRPDKEAS